MSETNYFKSEADTQTGLAEAALQKAMESFYAIGTPEARAMWQEALFASIRLSGEAD